jgi:predicted Holliday junction resolvase-like endonuclease
MQYLILIGFLLLFFVVFAVIMYFMTAYFRRINDRLEREHEQYQRWLKEQEWEENNLGI